MKWIPVTDGLPDVLNKKYVCKCYNIGTKKIVLKIVFLSQDKVFESRLEVIEWLDESEPGQRTFSLSDLLTVYGHTIGNCKCEDCISRRKVYFIETFGIDV